MKRDLNLVLKDPYGKTFADGMTLGKAMAQALMAQLPEDARQGIAERMELFRLLQRVVEGGVQEFRNEELVVVKQRAVASGFTLAGFGALSDALDRDHVELTVVKEERP